MPWAVCMWHSMRLKVSSTISREGVAGRNIEDGGLFSGWEWLHLEIVTLKESRWGVGIDWWILCGFADYIGMIRNSCLAPSACWLFCQGRRRPTMGPAPSNLKCTGDLHYAGHRCWLPWSWHHCTYCTSCTYSNHCTCVFAQGVSQLENAFRNNFNL